MTTICDLLTAMQAWDADECESMTSDSRDRMIAVARELLSSVPGVRSVEIETSTAGSDYLALVPDHDDACAVIVRISNHGHKTNSHEAPAWSFEPTDSLADCERGMKFIAMAVRDAIDYAAAIESL